ncbi:cathepsin 7-like [Meriones unguiculatus]|uniref:cathepsin 7-like n=1 Tax=Meriones unguiculatus TaxID=10047 RepID=UPI000B4EDF46|nr:cathepsin 7-like [Meriones unguiculatus]
MASAVFIAILCLGGASAAPSHDYTLDAEWEQWKRSYEKIYSPEEEKQRRAVWEENVKMVKLHSGVNGLWMNNVTVEMNGFGDRTGEEMRTMMNNSSVLTLRNGKHIQKCGDVTIPKMLDWRKESYVMPARSQGACCACWAFVVAGSLEGQLFRKTGKLIPLSVQNLLDCSQSFGSKGYKDNNISGAFRYVKNNRDLEVEATYPYEAKEGACRYHPECFGCPKE